MCSAPMIKKTTESVSISITGLPLTCGSSPPSQCPSLSSVSQQLSIYTSFLHCPALLLTMLGSGCHCSQCAHLLPMPARPPAKLVRPRPANGAIRRPAVRRPIGNHRACGRLSERCGRAGSYRPGSPTSPTTRCSGPAHGDGTAKLSGAPDVARPSI